MKLALRTKALKGAAGLPRPSLRYLGARRGTLRVYEDSLELGDWSIPFAEVESARLYEPLRPLRRAQVLEIETAWTSYQFGLSGGTGVEEMLPFQIERDSRRSPSLMALNVGLYLWVVGWVTSSLI